MCKLSDRNAASPRLFSHDIAITEHNTYLTRVKSRADAESMNLILKGCNTSKLSENVKIFCMHIFYTIMKEAEGNSVLLTIDDFF